MGVHWWRCAVEIESQNWPGILNFFQLPIPAYGRVVDADTGEAIAGAELFPLDVPFNYGELITTSALGRCGAAPHQYSCTIRDE